MTLTDRQLQQGEQCRESRRQHRFRTEIEAVRPPRDYRARQFEIRSVATVKGGSGLAERKLQGADADKQAADCEIESTDISPTAGHDQWARVCGGYGVDVRSGSTNAALRVARDTDRPRAGGV